jgi:hypothetical protein
MPFIIAQLALFVFLGFQLAQAVKTSPDSNAPQLPFTAPSGDHLLCDDK